MSQHCWVIVSKRDQIKNIKDSLELVLVGAWTWVNASLTQPYLPHIENYGHLEKQLLRMEHCGQMGFHLGLLLNISVHLSLEQGIFVPHKCKREIMTPPTHTDPRNK